MPTTPRDADALVFVAGLDAPVLDDDDAHHLLRVLRLRDGAAVAVADGLGAWRSCVLRGSGALEPDAPVVPGDGHFAPVTVAFAATKGDKPELVVQKLTELGVDCIIPFRAARSVVRWDDERGLRHVARWRRIAREAAMQSRRPRIPDVMTPCAFADVAALPGAVMADMGGEGRPSPRSVVLVGPEGGWSPEERAFGLPTVTLGDGVLRAETAAIAAGVLVTAARERPPGVHEP